LGRTKTAKGSAGDEGAIGRQKEVYHLTKYIGVTGIKDYEKKKRVL